MINPPYRPIESKEAFFDALTYLTTRVEELSVLVCGAPLPVSILKLFAVNDSEYEFIKALVSEHGLASENSSKMSFYVDVDSGLKVSQTPITLLGVRKPDSNKSYFGCGDYEIEDFETYAEKLILDQPSNTRRVEKAHGLGMVELFHADFDVLGYVVPIED